MTIEKVSKYISTSQGVSEPSAFGRSVLLSLPRVKWLEEKQESEPKKEVVKRNVKITPLQQQVLELHQSGLGIAQIAMKLSKSKNAISKLLGRIRAKETRNG